MKKLFTILSVLFCGLVSPAQTLTFRHEGKDIANGSTVYSSKVDPMDDPDLVASGMDFRTVKFIPELTLVSMVDARNVHIRLEGDDPRWAICCWGGCTPGAMVDKTGDLSADVALDPEIHFENDLFNFGEILTKKATISAWYDGREAEKVSFTLIVSNDPGVVSSVDDAKTVAPAITVNGRTLDYTFDKAAERTLSVYTLGGANVQACTLGNAAGSVSLGALPAGVYVYRVTGDAHPTGGKIIIK